MQISLEKWHQKIGQRPHTASSPKTDFDLKKECLFTAKIVAADQQDITSGQWLLELPLEQLLSGSIQLNLQIAPHARAHILIALPLEGTSCPVAFHGAITVGNKADCHISVIRPSAPLMLTSKIQYAVQEGARLKLDYLLNNRGLEDFQDKILLAHQAEVEMNALLHGADDDFKIFKPQVHHLAPQSRSQMNVRSVMSGHSQAYISGLIQVEPGASCEAHYKNNNLILSNYASVEAEPLLEILYDNLICSHGVALGPVDREQIMYLCSRGISEKEAQNLVLKGFVAHILDAFAPQVQSLVHYFNHNDILESL